MDNTHKIDDLGRIVIPENIRRTLGWRLHERMEISILDPAAGSACIRPEQQRCNLCGNADKLFSIKTGYICVPCKEELQELLAASLD